MNTFQKFASNLFEDLEGYRSDSSIDPGRLTIWGFSEQTRKNLGLPLTMKQSDAATALHTHWWLRLGCDKMHPAIGWLICDIHFNHSPKTATTIIQRALGGVYIDGKYGPRTMQGCIDIQNVKHFITTYAFFRRGYYAKRSGYLIVKYAASEKKLQAAITQEHGWQNRLDKLLLGMWDAGLLKREPSVAEETLSTSAVAIVAGAATAAITAAVPEGTTVLGVAKELGTLALSGDLTVSGVAAYGAGFVYNRWLKGKNFIPKFLRGKFK